ncbi:cellulose biosynthesis cyclic di-GMP-binding regulatory protein BcsB [Photobacterium sp. BZF1]|uniref:cellulose biosynthesis cyclic di-GMP-binding regulatory protein BcsB n=1 Tax=Photobacterium sp. BZF1 TaxID=1904457 RepID=UPI0016537273|nr:cellulose biosynthesis cyclic di-GMP-binding regulatory protein BcsB [Photobacterium sp. BZF1]MBC7006253.1 cellulose biosynthesis cyclic di-GMP-binding regulatory protein BcsB [Photobacterium sp. BZF1]
MIKHFLLACLITLLSLPVKALESEVLEGHQISLAQMGWDDGVPFLQGQKDSGIVFTTRHDEVITRAQLLLDLKVDDEVVESNATLGVTVNGQHIATLPLEAAFDSDVTYRLDIPPMLVTSATLIGFRLETEEDLLCPPNREAALQVTILPTSYITLESAQLNVVPDLSRFPLPFWDINDMANTPVNIALPSSPEPPQLNAATMLASWFGVVSPKKRVIFEVSVDVLPQQHTIVIGAPGQTVGSFTLPESDAPYIRVMQNPKSPSHNLLVIAGREKRDLRSAVWKLSKTGFKIQTTSATVEYQNIPRSKPYDSPRWIATDRPVYLRELVAHEPGMVALGVWHEPLDYTFRAAPDLFLWDGETIPLEIGYRFPTAPWIDESLSNLSVTFNQQYLAGLPVNRNGVLERLWHKVGGDIRQEQAKIPVQPYMIYGDNHLSLYFNIANKPDTLCSELFDNNIKSTVEDTSLIDLTRSSHFTQLPNLSFFIGASFPFTRYADFSQTVILLPEKPDVKQIQTLFELAARAGSATGTVQSYTRVFLGVPNNRQMLRNKDILAVSVVGDTTFNRKLFKGSPYHQLTDRLGVRDYTFSQTLRNWMSGDWQLDALEADRYLSAIQEWRGFLSYKSPWDSERVVVVATASDPVQITMLGADLQVRAINAAIRKDTAIITDNHGVRSFQVASQFPSGKLPWYKMIIWYANQHGAILAIVAVAFSSMTGLALHHVLAQRNRKRLTPPKKG